MAMITNVGFRLCKGESQVFYLFRDAPTKRDVADFKSSLGQVWQMDEYISTAIESKYEPLVYHLGGDLAARVRHAWVRILEINGQPALEEGWVPS